MPNQIPVEPNLAYPVQRYHPCLAKFVEQFKREARSGLDRNALEGYLDDAAKPAVEVAYDEVSLAKLRVPLNTVKQVLNRDHD